MKVTKYLLIFATAGCAFSFASCETFNNLFKRDTASQIKKEVVLPQDRESVAVETDPKMYSPEEFARGIIKGDWAIEKVYGQNAVGESVPFIKFANNEKRIYGNNGCNTVNGEYKYNPEDSTLSFSNIAVTMMLCTKVGITDYLVNKALNETTGYSLRDVDDGYLMNLYDAEGNEVMQLAHQNLDFLNGTWKVISIENEPVDIDKMKLVFDVDEHKVHGNTGCNVLNGRLETDLDTPNTFSFENIGVTMMMCPQMQYQTALLVALEEASRAKPINKNEVMLIDDSGNVVLTLRRTADK